MNLIEFKSVTIGDNTCVLDEKAERKVYDIYIGDGFAGKNIFHWSKSQAKKFPNQKGIVLASTEPMLPNLPKLIIKDEGEMLAEEYSKSRAETTTAWTSFADGFRANDKKHTDEDMIAFARNFIHELNRGHSAESALVKYEKEKPLILLILCDSSYNPIVTDNTITGYKK